MLVIRMRNSSEAKDMLKRVKKMAKYAEELEETLEDCMEDIDDDDDEYREDDEELLIRNITILFSFIYISRFNKGKNFSNLRFNIFYFSTKFRSSFII